MWGRQSTSYPWNSPETQASLVPFQALSPHMWTKCYKKLYRAGGHTMSLTVSWQPIRRCGRKASRINCWLPPSLTPKAPLELQSYMYKNMMQPKSFEEPGNNASFPCVCGVLCGVLCGKLTHHSRDCPTGGWLAHLTVHQECLSEWKPSCLPCGCRVPAKLVASSANRLKHVYNGCHGYCPLFTTTHWPLTSPGIMCKAWRFGGHC